jgi:hypothetical protein
VKIHSATLLLCTIGCHEVPQKPGADASLAMRASSVPVGEAMGPGVPAETLRSLVEAEAPGYHLVSQTIGSYFDNTFDSGSDTDEGVLSFIAIRCDAHDRAGPSKLILVINPKNQPAGWSAERPELYRTGNGNESRYFFQNLPESADLKYTTFELPAGNGVIVNLSADRVKELAIDRNSEKNICYGVGIQTPTAPFLNVKP